MKVGEAARFPEPPLFPEPHHRIGEIVMMVYRCLWRIGIRGGMLQVEIGKIANRSAVCAQNAR